MENQNKRNVVMKHSPMLYTAIVGCGVRLSHYAKINPQQAIFFNPIYDLIGKTTKTLDADVEDTLL